MAVRLAKAASVIVVLIIRSASASNSWTQANVNPSASRAQSHGGLGVARVPDADARLVLAQRRGLRVRAHHAYGRDEQAESARPVVGVEGDDVEVDAAAAFPENDPTPCRGPSTTTAGSPSTPTAAESPSHRAPHAHPACAACTPKATMSATSDCAADRQRLRALEQGNEVLRVCIFARSLRLCHTHHGP